MARAGEETRAAGTRVLLAFVSARDEEMADRRVCRVGVGVGELAGDRVLPPDTAALDTILIVGAE